MAISDALDLSLVSKVVGYKIKKLIQDNPQNLPMRIAILSEANTANQATVSFDNEFEFTSAKQVGLELGFGSPSYHIARILRPLSGTGVSGIPTVIYPIEQAAGATSRILEISPIGVATSNATHTLEIAGRTGIDGQSYNFTVNVGDTSGDITAKIEAVINLVLTSPVSCTSTDYEAVIETKWKGATAQNFGVSINTNGNDAGISYSVAETQQASGVPDVVNALDQFGNKWNTIVINSFGTDATIMNVLEEFNGIPDPNTPTGRYSPIIFKPFFAITGSVESNPSAYTDSRKDEVTITIGPAPLSSGFHFESAANDAYILAIQTQNNPHLDISGQSYPDMPTPSYIGFMSEYLNRDYTVKRGCSTVELANERYRSCDHVTTYHPDGETPPQFRYVRNLLIDWNVYYGIYLINQKYVVDKVIAGNDATITVPGVITPKDLQQILCNYFDQLESRGLITDAAFSKASLVVGISETNPDRLETYFEYKRSSYGRQSATTASAGFNFGSAVQTN